MQAWAERRRFGAACVMEITHERRSVVPLGFPSTSRSQDRSKTEARELERVEAADDVASVLEVCGTAEPIIAQPAKSCGRRSVVNE